MKVIEVTNLSKLYHIGTVETSYKTFSDSLASFIKTPFRRAARLLRGQAYGATDMEETIWALKDISFDVKQGEVVGIIGRNGAGKSTLLKILSRITEPTEGAARIKGRVGSLLEVGTGFHMELTGRENIFLNGAILGMKKREIKSKFNEIVSFAEVGKFIDTPVKFYSSGMCVRLAFAVAAHLEPEILLVDEVLAVGDVGFQRKCLGKMKDVAKGGRTVLFVSHSMTAIRNLCPRTILLDDGKLAMDADTRHCVAKYLDQNLSESAVVMSEEINKKVEGYINRRNPSIRFKEVALLNNKGVPATTFYSNEPITVSVTYECLTEVRDLRVVMWIVDEENRSIMVSQNIDDEGELTFHQRKPGLYKSSCVIRPDIFGQKHFYVSAWLEYPKVEHLILNKILGFDVIFSGYNKVLYGMLKDSFIRPKLTWHTKRVFEEELKKDSVSISGGAE